MLRECLYCVSQYEATSRNTGLCPSCLIVSSWLRYVTHDSETESLNLPDSPNHRYYVYVLETDRGWYVGHTGNLARRLREHRDGRSISTANANPQLAWKSEPLRSRRYADAAEPLAR